MQQTSTRAFFLFVFLPVFICVHAQYKQVEAGFYHTVALKADGTLWTWGYNTDGELGDGGSSYRSTPMQIGTDHYRMVAAGHYQSYAIRDDGTLWAWGSSAFGQIGDGATIDRHIPVQVGTDTHWAFVSSGYQYAMALKTDGTLWGWGNNSVGQIGAGSSVSASDVPIQIGTANDWVKLVCGHSHAMAINTGGQLWGWGYNSNGQIGNGSSFSDPSYVPEMIMPSGCAKVACGGFHTLAIKTDGSLWGWGRNDIGQLGDGTLTSQVWPVQIGTATDWDTVSAGYFYSTALKTNHTLWAWGYNNTGMLGDGTQTMRPSAEQIGSETDWAIVSAKQMHTMALHVNGTLCGTGYNNYGEIGDGTTNFTTSYACINVVLPLKLLSFTGQVTGRDAMLSWATDQEMNTLQFTVQRSMDGTSYTDAGSVDAQNTAGIHHYSFTDRPINAAAGRVYYRLKQTDMDGHFTYSNVLELTFGTARLVARIYPNPASSLAWLVIDADEKESVRCTVIDQMGRTVLQKSIQLNAGGNQVALETTGLAGGTYLLLLKGDHMDQQLKLVTK